MGASKILRATVHARAAASQLNFSHLARALVAAAARRAVRAKGSGWNKYHIIISDLRAA